MTQPVAEVVTFRLLDGCDPESFVKAAEALTPFLKQTGAARERFLSVDDDGLWTDHIRWTSMDQAKAAAAEIMAKPEAAPMMSMIDPGSVSMRHAEIRLAMD